MLTLSPDKRKDFFVLHQVNLPWTTRDTNDIQFGTCVECGCWLYSHTTIRNHEVQVFPDEMNLCVWRSYENFIRAGKIKLSKSRKQEQPD
ncbi:hypothetical protein D3C80_1926380 [compost metagenome]